MAGWGGISSDQDNIIFAFYSPWMIEGSHVWAVRQIRLFGKKHQAHEGL
jgi:hypothetical protein